MEACLLLIMSIVAVKPEDQGTFFQDFLGLSGYLCSVPEMLRTTMKPNSLCYLRVDGHGQCLGAGKTRSVENAAESHTSGACFVSPRLFLKHLAL
jgi:hypothetical protein